MRSLSNLECVGETLRAALDDVATLAPQWLLQQVASDWFERYSHRVEHYRLPKAETQRTALAEQIGADGLHLLAAVEHADAPVGMRELESVHLLRSIWQQYYDCQGGQAKWRAGPQPQGGDEVIRSPYDPEAQSGKKRGMSWFGYKVHFTETCALPTETGRPHLIVQVETTPAAVQDVEVTDARQEDLAKRNLLPKQHVVDTGYVSADLLLSSKGRGIKLVGPVLPDSNWQAKAGKGFAQADFQIDWQKQQATCPQGQQSTRWNQAGQGEVKIFFAPETCACCPVRSDCTRSQAAGRQLHVQGQQAYEILKERRATQHTGAFQQEYAVRAGIEGTISQAVRAMGARRARYDGLEKTCVQQVLTAVAINLVRIDAVLTGTPRGSTRRSHFARLAGHREAPFQASA